ncbi:MAG: Hpt domain-containing protein [Elusimicrobiota bacterium]
MSEPALDMSELLDLYKEDARRMIEAMRDTCRRWNEISAGGTARQELRRMSHQLRGSGRTYGYHNVSQISKALEQIMQRLEKHTLSADDRVKRSICDKIERLALIFQD